MAYLRYDRAHSRGPATEGLREGPTLGVTGLVTQNWRLILEYQRVSNSTNAYVLSTHVAF